MRSRSSADSPLVLTPGVEVPHSMQDCREHPRWTAYLHAGQVFVSSKPHHVLTILGSCVSVCLWDPRVKAGGMNHFLLPHGPANGNSSPRFGDEAFRVLVEELRALGCRNENLRAKVFGGARVLASRRSNGGDLGERNTIEAFTILEAENIPVVSKDVGGRSGRKLIFSVAQGYAWVKRIGG